MRLFITVAAFLISTLISAPAQAGEKVLREPAPDWVVPPEVPVTGGTEIMSLDRQIRFHDGVTTSFADMAIKVRTTEMANMSGNLTLPWHPDKGDLIIHRLEVIKPGRVIDVLASGQDFTVLRRETRFEQSWIDGQLTAALQIEGVEVGDIIRVSYSVTFRDEAMGGYYNAAEMIPLFDDMPIRMRIRVLWDISIPMRWNVTDKRIEPKVSTKGGVTEFLIEGSQPKALTPPSDAPMRYLMPPIVEFSSFPDWPTTSKVAAGLYDPGNDALTDAGLKAEVARIASASTDPRTRAAMALRLVQDNIRYVFNGMAGGNYTPSRPSETWARKYGDCKAKTLLLIALLRELGIEAEPVLVNATLGDFGADRLSGFQLFDHVIVRARLGDKWVWLDGTGSGSREEDIDDVPNFGRVLPATSSGSELVAISPTPATRPLTMAETEIDTRAGLAFPATFKTNIVLRGQLLTMLRMARETMGDTSNDFVDVIVIGEVGEGRVVERKIEFDDDKGTARISASGIVNMRWTTVDGRRSLNPATSLANLGFNADRSGAKNADIPVKTDFPSYQISRTRYILPKGGEGFDIEGLSTFNGIVAGQEVTLSATRKGDILTIERSVRTIVPELLPSSLAEIRVVVAKLGADPLRIAAPSNYPASAVELSGAGSNRALKPLNDAYDKLAITSPDDASVWADRALYHKGIKNRAKALADMDKLIEVQPTAANYIARANLRLDDNKTDLALEDLAKARELEPTSTEVIEMIATIYVKRKDIDGALKVVDDAEGTGPKSATLVPIRGEILFKGERYADAVTEMDRAIGLSPGSPQLLNQRCWYKGIGNIQLDTALKDCTKAIELSENPASVYDSRALVYYRMGRFDEALEDLDNALAKDSELAPSYYLRGIVQLRLGREAEGRADIEKALKIESDVADLYDRAGIKP